MTPCELTAWPVNRRGYGQGWPAGQNRKWLAHRWAWTQANGPIPPDMDVLHRCDNPPCIALDHLFLGTRADNNRDMAVKGRAAHGSGHWNARLTEADIPRIREMLARGVSGRRIAEAFGVTSGTISALARGRTWSHIR